MKRLSKRSKLLILIFSVVLLIMGCTAGFSYFTVMNQLSRIQYTPLPEDIMHFVKVDFFGLEKIVDKIGGVEIEVKKSEIPMMNNWIQFCYWRNYRILTKPIIYIKKVAFFFS